MPRVCVVGSGPNGLTAACRLATAGYAVSIFEQGPYPGGAAISRSVFGHRETVDIGAAVHPFGIVSPAFAALHLEGYGLRWIHPDLALAHPLEGRPAGILPTSRNTIPDELEIDAKVWRRLHAPLLDPTLNIVSELLQPMQRIPQNPVGLARFGLRGFPSASVLVRRLHTEQARALFAGSALHSFRPLEAPLTGAFGVLFGGLGMTTGWPIAQGGSQAIIDALVRNLNSSGVSVQCNAEIRDLRELPDCEAIIVDMLPENIQNLGGLDPSFRLGRSLIPRDYGPSVCKVDFLLDGPVPWFDRRVQGAGTVHVGGTTPELAYSETLVHKGVMPDRPFILVGQQAAADPTRKGLNGVVPIWTYAHVPFGYDLDCEGLVASQIERFAPGFRDRILETCTTSASGLEKQNPNLHGGNINGGSLLGLRKAFYSTLVRHPYRLSPRGLYICSSATPPGPGVHGMNGWNAAGAVMKDYPLNSFL